MKVFREKPFEMWKRNIPKPISVLDEINNLISTKEKQKQEKKNHLSEWGNMKKQNITEDLKLEWKLIQHENLFLKSEYQKMKKCEKMPKYFQIATLINRNNNIKVGSGNESQSLHTFNRRKKKTLSTLKSFEKNNELKKWCIKKYTKIQTERNIGGKSFLKKQKKLLLKMQNGK